MYSCDICDKNYQQKRNLRRHMKEKHHEHEHIFCQKCSSSFIRRGYLNDHLKNVHNLDNDCARKLSYLAMKDKQKMSPDERVTTEQTCIRPIYMPETEPISDDENDTLEEISSFINIFCESELKANSDLDCDQNSNADLSFIEELCSWDQHRNLPDVTYDEDIATTKDIQSKGEVDNMTLNSENIN